MSDAGPTGRRIYEELRRMAAGFELPPDERVNEVELAARFGSSRTPVREALQRLVTEGLITFRANHGFYCRSFRAAEVVDLSELRAVLEQHAVRLATGRAGDGALAALAAHWSGVVAGAGTLSAEALTDADEAFHREIARLSGNSELPALLEAINIRIRFVRRIGVERPARRGTTLTEHGAIVAAMMARDADRAAALIRDHIALSASDAVAVVEEGLARIRARVQARAG